MALLSARDLWKIYGSGDVQVFALREINLDIERGELMIIVGPSGSGKSTLLNMIGGMDRPSRGQLVFEGKDLAQANDRQLTLYRRQQVGFVFQFFNLVPTLTALENVQVAVQIARQPMDAAESLAIVGLQDRANFFPSQMSGGQQQRVAIARALASNPPLLLCDEPTGNLDTETGRQVLQLLVRVNRELGKTVVIISHSSSVARVGNRVAYIRDGAILSLETNANPADPADIEW
ncbi:ABC transporter ATP-binding protein [bacterium]|nr:ABC transporter ATP-binding protein [bacterium]